MPLCQKDGREGKAWGIVVRERRVESATDAVADPRLSELEREVAELRSEVRMLRMANGELERVVVRDTLTPLYNRRYFLTALNERIARLTRYGASAMLVFVDVDGLKQVNDSHGHNAGDYALVHVARQLAANIRTTDVAARMGGDEFALLFDEMDADKAREKIAALDAAICQNDCDFGGARLSVFASFGMADVRAGERDEDVIARADADMYLVKREKRALLSV